MSSEHEIKGPEPRFAAWLMEPMRRNRPVYLKVALAATESARQGGVPVAVG